MFLSPSLNKLRELAPGLNNTADDAAKIVHAVESILTKELSLGIEAAVQFKWLNITQKKSKVSSLSHRRVAGKFRIAVIEEIRTEFVNDNNCPDIAWELTEEIPWDQCPRDTKLESFPCLPKLLEKLIENAEETQKRVEEAKKTVREILGTPILAAT